MFFQTPLCFLNDVYYCAVESPLVNRADLFCACFMATWTLILEATYRPWLFFAGSALMLVPLGLAKYFWRVGNLSQHLFWHTMFHWAASFFHILWIWIDLRDGG